jgi:hypothetical protein
MPGNSAAAPYWLPRPGRTRVVKNWLRNIGVIFVSFVLTVLALEIVLRFTPYHHLLQRDNHLTNYYQFDPVKGYDIRPNVRGMRLSVDNRLLDYDIWSNELGCFDEPYRGEPDVILLLGDSFTHMFAPFQNKWGTRLEDLLQYRVLKCGVEGYGTKQELLKAQDIIGRINQPPRLIIVGYFWNDIIDDLMFPNLTVVDGLLVSAARYRNKQTGDWDLPKLQRSFSLWDKVSQTYPLSFMDQINYFLDRHFITLNLVNDASMRMFPAHYAYADPLQFWLDDPQAVHKAWPQHQENLLALKKLTEANHAGLLMVLVPTRTMVYPFLSTRTPVELEGPNKLVRQFFREAAIPYIDLLPLFKSYADQRPRKLLSSENDLFYRYTSHWNSKGERLAALLVARHILKNDLVTVADRDQKLTRIEDQLRDFR